MSLASCFQPAPLRAANIGQCFVHLLMTILTLTMAIRYAGRTDAMKLHYDDKHPTEAYPANHRWPRLITVLKEHNVQLVGHMKVSPLPPPLPELKPEVQRTKWTLPKNPARTLLAAPLLTSPSTTISSMGPSTPQVQLTLPLNVDLLQGPETSTTMDAVGLLPPAEHIYMGLTLPSTSYLGNQTPYSSYSNNHSYPAIASNQYMMPSYYPTGANMMFYPGATGPIMANDLAIGQIDLGFLGLDTEPEALSLPNPAYSDPLFNGFQFQYNHI